MTDAAIRKGRAKLATNNLQAVRSFHIFDFEPNRRACQQRLSCPGELLSKLFFSKNWIVLRVENQKFDNCCLLK